MDGMDKGAEDVMVVIERWIDLGNLVVDTLLLLFYLLAHILPEHFSSGK